MRALIEAAISRSRATVTLLVFLFLAGLAAYQSIPKESNPDVAIPMMYVSMTLDGVSPEDAERLLIRPMEHELRSLEGLKKMTSTGSEGFASVMLEFDAGFDPDKAIADVREKVDMARSRLPAEADEPVVHEINVALFPVLSIGLAGPVSQQQLIMVARELRDNIEAIPEVLEVDIGGDREDMLEIIADPQVLETYGVDYLQLYSIVSNNNRLVAAGSLDTGVGRMSIKVPGVVEDLDDILNMPLKVDGDTVVTFADVATISRSFKDPQGFARINGDPAVVLEVKKRSGANIIETIEQTRALVAQAKAYFPPGMEVTYIMDQSDQVRTMLDDLLNNVLTAVVLVLILIIASMGVRSALLVGITIPGAFLAGILLISLLGYTMNIVVLFSLILVAGMLVDGAIVVSELADRNLADGQSPKKAWADAASRMSWPIIASTATTIAVFAPLLFWPGIIGQFMKYLPATVILCLLCSLVMALVFLPTLGSVSRRRNMPKHELRMGRAAQLYARALHACLLRPGRTLLGMIMGMVLIYTAYGKFNHGVEFFPEVEPESAQVWVRSRGDYSIMERDAILRKVENRLRGLSEVKALYARSMVNPSGEMPPDVIGVLQFQFIDWFRRRPAAEILEQMRQLTDDVVGVKLEFRNQEDGPSGGKPIELQVSGIDRDKMDAAVDIIIAKMNELGGFKDIEDNRSLPGVEWRVEVDRAAAARFGADVLTVGNAVQLITNGLLLARYRPEYASDEVDIRVRFPKSWRSLEQMKRLTVNTPRGQVPLSNFVKVVPGDKTSVVNRVNGNRAITIKSDLVPGAQVAERLQALLDSGMDLPDVKVTPAGESEDQQEAATFLGTAFLVAIFIMLMILLVQFNSWYQSLLIISAIVFSTAGVLLGLLVNNQPFGIVMVGMGIIGLAGIVVNNNIVLIDTYNQIRDDGANAFDAAYQTGCLRLRPVMLTSVTTILGLMPMALGINVNLMEPSLGFGAPSTQWWTQLSSAIAGGLAIATLLTLLLTPCMLILGDKLRERSKARAHQA